MKLSSIAILIALSCIGCNQPYGSTTDTSAKPGNAKTTTDRDNTAVNQRDRDSATKTPLDQNENKVDIGITADIRKRVVDTKMSVNAQNVKIITQDGKVTLRGPVKTEDEKKQIEVIARSVAGENNVDSQLEVEQTP
jgi:hyperosmotically inducible periplasmic protein